MQSEIGLMRPLHEADGAAAGPNHIGAPQGERRPPVNVHGRDWK